MANSDHANLKDYESWRRLNAEPFSLFDYAYAVARARRLPADALMAFGAIIWPSFRNVGGMVLLAEQYDPTKLEYLRSQGLSERKIEYWMNLLCIDGFFKALPGATAWHMRSFAETLCQTWRAKLSRDFPTRRFRVEIVVDDEVGDVCVVFYREDL